MENEVLKSKCNGCGCEMDYYYSYINKHNGKRYYSKVIKKHCSKACCSKHQQRRKTCICEYCKNSFIAHACKNNKYCSRQCVNSDSKNRKRKPRKKYKITKKIEYKYKNCKRCNLIMNGRKYCKECVVIVKKEKQKAFSKINNDNRKRIGTLIKRILIHMSGGCCQKCGYNENISCLTFHHRNPLDKVIKMYISELAFHDIEDIILEHSKCDLLCHNCHFDLHNVENSINCKKSYKNTRNRDMKRKMNYIKECGGKCLHCSRIFHEDNIQSATFHHKYDKKFNLTASCMSLHSKEDVDNEIKKCDLLCMNCHMTLHHPKQST